MHLHLNERTSSLTHKRKYLSLLSPRITNLDLPLTKSINVLKMEDSGRLVRIRGTIVQASDETIEFIWRTFKCGRCDTQQVVLQRDGKGVSPNQCKVCDQRGSHYEEEIDSYFNCAIESQSLNVQELKKSEENDVLAVLEIILKHDLVNTVVPGTDVMCDGVLKTRVDGGQDRRYSLYLDVVSLQCNEDVDEKNFDYSESDYLVKMKAEPDPFRLLVHSLCPKIIGQELIKAALVLGLFSVSPKDFTGPRRETHILLVGDPGLGKSEMLEACSTVAPRGIFVSSNNCSNSGLTASMSHDSAQKSVVEAGALVMADQGVCCIDELDKILTNTDVLLEAMDEQIVNVSKAGVINKLRAKTSILAAANPIGGHYNKAKRVTDNLKIQMPILTRFDLIIIMLDQRSSHLEGKFRKVRDSPSTSDSPGDLYSRLVVDPHVPLEQLSASSFQKYISYANRKCVPELSLEAKLVLKNYFITLRNRPFFSDMIPVTPRTLLSLVRLTLARAKIDLARMATTSHVEDIIQLMEFGMQDVANITEEDIIAQSNMQSREVKLSRAKQLSNFTRIVQIRAKDRDTKIFDKADLKELADHANVRNLNEILDLMNANGVLLYKGNDTYQFVNY